MGIMASVAGALGTSTATAGGVMGGAMGLLTGMSGYQQKKVQKQMQANQEAAEEQARRLQKIELVKALNWQEASTRLEFKNLMDSAVDELTEVNFAAIRNSSAAAAGISESGMEGRTTARAQRKVDQVALRQASRVTENYERDYASLLGEREKQWQAGLSAIKGVGEDMRGKGGSSSKGYLDVISSTISGTVSGHQLGSRVKINKESK